MSFCFALYTGYVNELFIYLLTLLTYYEQRFIAPVCLKNSNYVSALCLYRLVCNVLHALCTHRY